jgi:hypothetical protein
MTLKPNGQSRNRTGDTRIFSPVLYQLSYLPWALYALRGYRLAQRLSTRPPVGQTLRKRGPLTLGLSSVCHASRPSHMQVLVNAPLWISQCSRPQTRDSRYKPPRGSKIGLPADSDFSFYSVLRRALVFWAWHATEIRAQLVLRKLPKLSI